MTKLEELVEKAKTIPYIAPNNVPEEWTNMESIYAALYLALHSDIQVKALYVVSNMFPPIKFVANTLLNMYIKNFEFT